MIESLLLLITAFLLFFIPLIVGFNLGKHQSPISPTGQERINRIMRKVAPPRSDVGAIERPTAQDNYYRDNPRAKVEDEAMGEAIETLKR